MGNTYGPGGRKFLHCRKASPPGTHKGLSARSNLPAVRTKQSIGVWDRRQKSGRPSRRHAREMHEGELADQVTVDALQGGAGTSTNMNVNEVIANRALVLLGEPAGRLFIGFADRRRQSAPVDQRHLPDRPAPGLHPGSACAGTAALVALQEACQAKERGVCRTSSKSAAPNCRTPCSSPSGREIGAWAEAFNRDRWRIYKCEERLRVVNLGGTAIGTGLGAPREFIFKVVDELRDVTGIGFARARKPRRCDAERRRVRRGVGNSEGMRGVALSKYATTSGCLPAGLHGGFGEIALQPLQAGSSIMPGKVNPVIPEAAAQAALLVFGHDTAITMAAASGNLELNHQMPLIAHCLLESIDVLTAACDHSRDEMYRHDDGKRATMLRINCKAPRPSSPR